MLGYLMSVSLAPYKRFAITSGKAGLTVSGEHQVPGMQPQRSRQAHSASTYSERAEIDKLAKRLPVGHQDFVREARRPFSDSQNPQVNS